MDELECIIKGRNLAFGHIEDSVPTSKLHEPVVIHLFLILFIDPTFFKAVF